MRLDVLECHVYARVQELFACHCVPTTKEAVTAARTKRLNTTGVKDASLNRMVGNGMHVAQMAAIIAAAAFFVVVEE